jgi:Leucine Rich repeats (2 copies)
MAKAKAKTKAKTKAKAKPTKAAPKAKAKAKPAATAKAIAKAKPAAKAKAIAKAKPAAKAKKSASSTLALYESLHANVFETVFANNATLIEAFIAWAQATHPTWYAEVDEDDNAAGRAVKVEILITDEVEEAAFVAFFETLPEVQKAAAIAAMEAAAKGDDDEEEEDDGPSPFMKLSGLGLTELPAELANQTHITHLNLANNKLETLPAWIATLTNLEQISLSENPLGALPVELAACAKLKTLILYKCEKAVVPPLPALRTVVAQATSASTIASLAASPSVVSINAMDTGLTALPEELRALKELAFLDLSGNKFKTLPRWLAELPLEALHLGGNPLPESEVAWARALVP